MKEQQPPVAHANPFAQLQADSIRVVEVQVDLLQEIRARAFQFLIGRGILANVFNRLEESVPGFVRSG